MLISERIKQKYLFLKKTLKREDVLFRIMTMLKLTLLSLSPFLLILLLLGLFYKINMLYFSSLRIEASEIIVSTFFDFIYQRISPYFLPISLFLSALMFLSIYIAELMLRPFATISQYCLRRLNDEKHACYDPLFYADLKLLNNFGEIFFNYMEHCQEKKILSTFKVPQKYLQIHRPVIEFGFFVHFSFWIIITSTITAVSLNVLATELHLGLVEYSLQIIKNVNPSHNSFIMGQGEIFTTVVWTILIVYLIMSFMLVSHLYNQVSKPAFAFFSTMRAFLKGNHNSRVHMLGHYYIREHSRNFNKYLDFLGRKLKTEYDIQK